MELFGIFLDNFLNFYSNMIRMDKTPASGELVPKELINWYNVRGGLNNLKENEQKIAPHVQI